MTNKDKSERRDWSSVTVRLQRPLFNDLQEICNRLNLERAEVARRAIRVGLKSFADARLPGGVEAAVSSLEGNNEGQ